MKTIQDILTSGTAYLEARGIEGARHSMQSLMVHVLGCNRTWLYLHYEDPLSEEKLVPLRELLKRRGKGEPLQHLLGSTEFYRREFRTDSRALIPRPETEELVEFALQMAPRRQGMRVLDMGCGSGIRRRASYTICSSSIPASPGFTGGNSSGNILAIPPAFYKESTHSARELSTLNTAACILYFSLPSAPKTARIPAYEHPPQTTRMADTD